MRNTVNESSRTVRECDVFISYRRDGGDMTAMYFYQALKERGYNVFYDLEVLRAGKFNEALLDSIRSCKDFVLILSPHALDRCNEENDWVRREIAEALRTKKNIVPVMMKGFQFPEKLPDDIDDIRYQNGLTSTTEYFEESIDRLCTRYLNTLPATEKKSKKAPIVPIVAALAVLVAVIGGWAALRGRQGTPAPEPMQAVVTEAPTAAPTEAPTQAPTEAPTAVPTEAPTQAPTAAPTEVPGPRVVKDTDFPALTQDIDEVDSAETGDAARDDEMFRNSKLLNHPTLRRRDVASLTFLPTLEGAPEDAWDVSAEGDGRVLAWIVPNGALYDLTIAGDGGVKFQEARQASRLFEGFSSMETVNFNSCVDLSARDDIGEMFYQCYALRQIDFSGVCTERVNCMVGLFIDCRSLETLDLSAFDTGRVTRMDEMFLGCERLRTLDLESFDTGRVTTMASMFDGCAALEALDLARFDTSKVNNMEKMFRDCRALERLDVGGFNTERVETMLDMFSGCETLEALDVSGFDTGRVETMFGMFRGCANLRSLNLTHFNTARVTEMGCMFFGCELLDDLDLSGFDTSKVETMAHMFNSCGSMFRLDLSGFDTSNVRTMEKMFSCDRALVEVNLAGWDVSKVEDMEEMFSDCARLESLGRDPATFGHGDTRDMYEGTPLLEQLSASDAEEAATIRDTDYPALILGADEIGRDVDLDTEEGEEAQRNAPAFNSPTVRRRDVATVTFLPTLEGAPEDARDVSEAGDGRVLAWETENGGLYDLFIAGDGGVKILENAGPSPLFTGFSSVVKVNFNGCVDLSERTDWSRLFWNCERLEAIDFEGVCADNATNVSGIFGFCKRLASVDLSVFHNAKVEEFGGMFLGCERLTELDLTQLDTSAARSIEAMFASCKSLETLDLSPLNTSGVTRMECLFEFCENLRTVDFTGVDTSRVVNMERMFGGCNHLETLDLSGFDTARVINMQGMFDSCLALRNINVSSFDTGRVTDMREMFCCCASLETVDVSGFDTSRVRDMSNMFSGDTLLDGLDLTRWQTPNATNLSEMFAGCESLYSLDLTGFDVRGVADLSGMFRDCATLVECLVTDWDVSGAETMREMFRGDSLLENIGRAPETFGHGDTEGMYEGCERLMRG